MPKEEPKPIVIRRVEEDAHDGHHGGGWKVAYADFMTAMMAFFLLMWIIAASDEEKLRGIADYFTPSVVTADGAGTGLLDGEAIEGKGTRGGGAVPDLPSFGQENPMDAYDSPSPDAPPAIVVEYLQSDEPSMDPFARLTAAAAAGEAETEVSEEGSEIAEGGALSEEQRREAELTEQREAELEALREEVERRLADAPELARLSDNLVVDATRQGLRLQVVEHEGTSMFRSGSAEIEQATRELLEVIGAAIRDLPYPVAIKGHTDAVPFASDEAGYGNWELSADRANAARRILNDAGIEPGRIVQIAGLAATEPFDAEDPSAPENRRIEVLLRYPEITDATRGVGR
ncbi:flagellar motor protein MotB [Histidinibacterium aquaticum]|uniref:flagellar motor protein MotB n=1 Tax=Histidinibacterium aquaticum TaxID=2613962 RepID=UPI001CC77FD0|nr:flagellar motor protein MotB [Histidinibacterium aquaticum]